jgi:hypothetical protein
MQGVAAEVLVVPVRVAITPMAEINASGEKSFVFMFLEQFEFDEKFGLPFKHR